MLITIIVVIGLITKGLCLYNTTSSENNKSLKPNLVLVENIRRQLMLNNYDYEPSEEDQIGLSPTPRVHEATENKPVDNEVKENINVEQETTTKTNQNSELIDDVVREALLDDAERTDSVNQDEVKHKQTDNREENDDYNNRDTPDHFDGLPKDKKELNSYALPHSTVDKARATYQLDLVRDVNLRAKDSSQISNDSKEGLNSRVDRIHDMVNKYNNKGGTEFPPTKHVIQKHNDPDYDGHGLRREGQRDDSIEIQKPERVSKNDLLYYVDDERLSRRRANKPSHQDLDEVESAEADGVTTDSNSAKVKYKVFQIHKRHPTRRHSQARKFVEERAEDGVAFIKLDAGPFPQFRLPRSRRQYMGNDDDVLADAVTAGLEDVSLDIENTTEVNRQDQEETKLKEVSEDTKDQIKLERDQEEELRRHLLKADKEFQDALRQLKNVA